MEQKIDFVILWVDPQDEEWQKEKVKYTENKYTDTRNVRYRDWDTLKYWFRGVEKYAPWVNKIHFVTYGHLPKFLNTNNPKLNIVNHKDFIPKEYLPTFSSHPIELNLHKIKDLSEQFVYFNDDMFVINKVKPTDFFKNGKPRDMASLTPIISTGPLDITNICLNNMSIINSEFNKRRQIRKNFFKWYNLKYGKYLFKTILLSAWDKFTGITEHHLCSNFLKTSYNIVWDKYFSIIDETCKHKFRDLKQDVNQWLIRDWQIAEGNFIPRSYKFGKAYFELNSNIISEIMKSKYKVVCINDPNDLTDEEFQALKKELCEAFEKKFPEKSKFEI